MKTKPELTEGYNYKLKANFLNGIGGKLTKFDKYYVFSSLEADIGLYIRMSSHIAHAQLELVDEKPPSVKKIK